MYKANVKTRYPCLFLILEVKHWSFTVKFDVGYRLLANFFLSNWGSFLLKFQYLAC